MSEEQLQSLTRDMDAALNRVGEMVQTNKHITKEVFASDLVQHLVQTIAFRIARIKAPKGAYVCPEHWILMHGRPFAGRPKPPGYRFGPQKQCYKNSADPLMGVGPAKKKLARYVEGYCTGIIPFPHAWNLDQAGEVVDLTLRPVEGDTGKREYFGVEFNREFLCERVAAKNQYALVFDWEDPALLVDDSLLDRALVKS